MASNSIKGLTVEINGDTSKLGKALEGVNKKTRDLSQELGQINKLLKLDPGNTDLLAQKQRVLADAVANTRTKLDTLRQAQAQVQEQFERGEVSEEQVRALQREIIATTRKLDDYEKAARETAEAVERLGDSSGEAEDGADDVRRGSDRAADSLDDLADSSKKAEKAGDGLGAKLSGAVKTGLAAVAAAATAAVGALVGAAESTREYRTAMGKLDTAFETAGHSSEAATTTYKALQGVLGDSDQAVEASNHLAQLATNEQDLATWTDIATGVYATFGDSLPIENLTEASNETAKTGQITGGLADALNWAGVSEEAFQAKLDACSSEQERQALITETLNGLYSEAADKYRETNAEVIRANEANEAWTASLAGVGGAIEPILTDVKMLGASLLSDLMPGVQGVADAFRGLLNGDEGAAEGLGTALSGILTQLLGKITELLPTLVNVAMGLITTLATTLISMLPQLIETGVQIIVAILDGLTSAIPQIVQALVEMIPRLVQALVSGIPLIIQGAVQLLLAIVDAIPQLLPPLIEAIPQIVMAIINALLGAIPQLIQGALQFLLAIVEAIPQLVAALVPAIPQIVTTVINALLDNIPLLLDAAVTLLLAIVKAIPQICVELIRALPQIWQTMSGYFKQLPGKLWAILKSLISNFSRWATESRQTMKDGAQKVLNAVVDTLKNLPGKIWTWLSNALGKVTSWGSQMVTKAKDAVKKMVTAVVDKVKELPGKMLSAGKDLVRGLWDGINGAYTWLKDKIKGWVGNVTDFLKSLFGINSPSKVTAWMGEMLDEGFAQGIEDNTGAPLDAMSRLSSDMIDAAGMDGLTLSRRIDHTFGAPSAAQSGADMIGKLDQILNAIQRGQTIVLDGDTLVGSTADRYDNKLGQRRVLAARGAL